MQGMNYHELVQAFKSAQLHPEQAAGSTVTLAEPALLMRGCVSAFVPDRKLPNLRRVGSTRQLLRRASVHPPRSRPSPSPADAPAQAEVPGGRDMEIAAPTMLEAGSYPVLEDATVRLRATLLPLRAARLPLSDQPCRGLRTGVCVAHPFCVCVGGSDGGPQLAYCRSDPRTVNVHVSTNRISHYIVALHPGSLWVCESATWQYCRDLDCSSEPSPFRRGCKLCIVQLARIWCAQAAAYRCSRSPQRRSCMRSRATWTTSASSHSSGSPTTPPPAPCSASCGPPPLSATSPASPSTAATTVAGTPPRRRPAALTLRPRHGSTATAARRWATTATRRPRRATAGPPPSPARARQCSPHSFPEVRTATQAMHAYAPRSTALYPPPLLPLSGRDAWLSAKPVAVNASLSVAVTPPPAPPYPCHACFTNRARPPSSYPPCSGSIAVAQLHRSYMQAHRSASPRVLALMQVMACAEPSQPRVPVLTLQHAATLPSRTRPPPSAAPPLVHPDLSIASSFAAVSPSHRTSAFPHVLTSTAASRNLSAPQPPPMHVFPYHPSASDEVPESPTRQYTAQSPLLESPQTSLSSQPRPETQHR